MAEKRDYYEVLGLEKSASADDIKGAYRKAALKWHPDRWVSGTDAEKKTAEEKFKEASEAYSVLSDPDKKARYDQFGFAGVEGAGGAQFWRERHSSWMTPRSWSMSSPSRRRAPAQSWRIRRQESTAVGKVATGTLSML